MVDFVDSVFILLIPIIIVPNTVAAESSKCGRSLCDVSSARLSHVGRCVSAAAVAAHCGSDALVFIRVRL